MSTTINSFDKVAPGTRVFILGNGPSLAKTPLEKLIGEYSWAVNQVHLIFPKTVWRPTHWTFAEMTAGSSDWFPRIHAAVAEANKIPGCKTFARADAWWLPGSGFRGQFFDACTHHDWWTDVRPDEDMKAYAWHFPQVCKYGGSVPMTIQLAVMHGFSEIILVGCDLGHKPGHANHFTPEYGLDITEQKAWKRNGANKAGHELAFDECTSRGIRIVNATIGGELEVYPRVRYDDLF